MFLTFEDRVAIVTGAGAGLGRAYAMELASRGARVIVNDYGGTVDGQQPGSGSVAQAVVDAISASGGAAQANHTDVGAARAGVELVSQAMDTWGRLDIVINNAGATRGGLGIEANTVEDLLFSFNVHVAGAFRLLSASWPHLVRQGYGRVVNVSSDSLWGVPATNYVTCKAAIFGLTRAMAAETAGQDVKVNTVMPSAWTRMTADLPPGQFRDAVERHFTAEGAASFVTLLAHERCPWNGEAFQVGAHRAAREFLAVTSGFRAKGDAVESFLENADMVVDSTRWAVPRSMTESVEMVIADLEGRAGC